MKLQSDINCTDSVLNNKKQIKIKMNKKSKNEKCGIPPSGSKIKMYQDIFTCRRNKHNKIIQGKNLTLILIALIVCARALPTGWKLIIWERKNSNTNTCNTLGGNWNIYNTCKQPDSLEHVNYKMFQLDGNQKWHSSNKMRNKMIKMRNGNGRNSVIIAHWNLGPRFWKNKVEEIQWMVDELKPDIAYISEANLWETDNDHEIQIEGYRIEHPLTRKKYGISRLVALIRENLQYKIAEEIMDDDITSIWIILGGRGRKNTITGGVYREFTMIGNNTPADSENPREQTKIWSKFLRQWRKAGRMTSSCHLTGDTNLDKMRWNSPDNGTGQMIEETKDEIETENFVQLVQGPTHFWPGREDSLIDQAWTNKQGSIISCKNLERATADHNLILTTIRLKGNSGQEQEIIKRNRKNFIAEDYQKEISKIDWEPLYRIKNLDIAYDHFENSILNILDKMAPMCKAQPRKNVTNWVSQETRDKMLLRNIARENARKSKREDDWSLL